MALLPVILCYECYSTISLTMPEDASIFNMWYYLGWGLCNEAGIMICMSLPFIFYLIGKSTNFVTVLYNNVKFFVAVFGIILTTSRGSYIFGLLIIALSYFALTKFRHKYTENQIKNVLNFINIELKEYMTGTLDSQNHTHSIPTGSLDT